MQRADEWVELRSTEPPGAAFLTWAPVRFVPGHRFSGAVMIPHQPAPPGVVRRTISHPAKANGARIAVSFAKAASENQMAIARGRSSRYAHSPQKVSPAAARSTCASELCAKNTGYRPVHS